MQQWYTLSDPAMQDALYEAESMRRFAGLGLSDHAMPDETTILKFRHAHYNCSDSWRPARNEFTASITFDDGVTPHAPVCWV